MASLSKNLLPSTVQMLQTVRGDIPGNSLIARKGEEYSIEVNPKGAVSAVVDGGILGLKPGEYIVASFEWQ